MRPNFFVNTPDILHAYLQYGGPPAFEIRAVLAATLSPTWGVYAGYELCENVAAAARAARSTSTPRSTSSARATGPPPSAEGRTLAPYLTRLNQIRRAHPALQRLRNLHFHHADNDAVIAYSQAGTSATATDTVLVVVNLDPHDTQEATVSLDMPALGLDWHDTDGRARRADRRDLSSGARTTTCASTRASSPPTSSPSATGRLRRGGVDRRP